MMLRVASLIFGFLLAASAHADVFDDYGRKHNINPNVLRSIASIESNLNPHAVNFDGESFTTIKSRTDAVRLINAIKKHPFMVRVDIPKVKQPERYFYDNLAAASARKAAVAARIAAGELSRSAKISVRRLDVKNFDVGLMQINHRWHGSKFADVDSMFDIHKNLDYAASYIKSLQRKHGSVTKAIAHYHSPTDWRQEQYLSKFDRSYRSWERTIASLSGSAALGAR